MGGLRLPNLEAYHLAVTLDQIKHWWHNSTEKSWVGMQVAALGISDRRAVLLDPVPEPLQMPYIPLPARKTLQYWKQISEGTRNQDALMNPSLSALSHFIFQICSWTTGEIREYGRPV